MQLIIWTVPLVGALALLVWRLGNTSLLDENMVRLGYLVLLGVLIYQIVRILMVNVPILKKGVPEDDRYKFKNVAALNTTYFANFGAELAVVSMLPTFFETVWSLGPAMAGLIASSFAFVNLFARPLGGFLSDRMRNRKMVMLVYMAGITIGFFVMSLTNSQWPLFLAVIMTILTSLFVQGAEGATFAIIPMIKKRITGQVAGMAGAYGNVGAVTYLTIFTMVNPNQFFLILSGGALISFLFCLAMLEEPEGSFNDEYSLSSVDREMMSESAALSDAKASPALQASVNK